MNDVKGEIFVEGLGNIVSDNSVFDDALNAVLKKSDRLISGRDLAYARIQDSEINGDWRNSSLCMESSYINEGILIVPSREKKYVGGSYTGQTFWSYNCERKILLRDSLVLLNPSEAVEARKNKNDYILPKTFSVDEHLEKIGKDNYLVIKNNDDAKDVVPTLRFGEDERTVFLFKDQAKKYGEFLYSVERRKMFDIYIHNGISTENKWGPLANQLVIPAINYYDILFCGTNNFVSSSLGRVGIRGVRIDSEVKSELEKSLK